MAESTSDMRAVEGSIPSRPTFSWLVPMLS